MGVDGGKIVVLDGHTLNPGDLRWAELEALGPLTVYDRTPPDEVLPRAAGARAVLTNKTVLGRAEIEGLPELRYIGVLATGFDVVNLDAARRGRITVTNVPAYATMSVAQMTMALLLEFTHRLGEHSRAVREGRWTASPDFCFWDYPLVELAGLSLGVVGFGNIGRAVASAAQCLGMHVRAARRGAPDPASWPVSFVDLETLFRQSDVVSLHCPLTPETEGLVNAERLSWMKPTAYLINTARGRLVDEQALADALNGGHLAGAGLDVLSREPPSPDNPLLTARNCLVTPHIAWATKASRERLLTTAVENLRAFLERRPKNVVVSR
ncbi:MAG: D-2-hydroxyacid dehydrogenase [Deltaproteobacteria bacterium]|nr:D-2-hydroxyacid dehydrogenase [Deltaproteobacteria bacterium]